MVGIFRLTVLISKLWPEFFQRGFAALNVMQTTDLTAFSRWMTSVLPGYEKICRWKERAAIRPTLNSFNRPYSIATTLLTFFPNESL
jgi:hypothetical protein